MHLEEILGVLRRILDKEIVRRMDERLREENLNMAQLDNLERFVSGSFRTKSTSLENFKQLYDSIINKQPV